MLRELKDECQRVEAAICKDRSSKKALADYSRCIEAIANKEKQMKQREDKALMIAETNSAIFIPVSMIDTVLSTHQTNGESNVLLRSTHLSESKGKSADKSEEVSKNQA